MKLLSGSVGIVTFFSKKATFGGSYPGYVNGGFWGAGTYCMGTGFTGINWLGIGGAPMGYDGIVATA